MPQWFFSGFLLPCWGRPVMPPIVWSGNDVDLLKRTTAITETPMGCKHTTNTVQTFKVYPFPFYRAATEIDAAKWHNVNWRLTCVPKQHLLESKSAHSLQLSTGSPEWPPQTYTHAQRVKHTHTDTHQSFICQWLANSQQCLSVPLSFTKSNFSLFKSSSNLGNYISDLI